MISGNFSEFDRAMAKYQEEWIATLFGKVMRALALAAFSSIVMLTPVDTGRARNGWDISLNAASGFTPPEGAASYPAADTGKVAQALAGLKLGDVIYITNNVVYIKPLNDGWSDQAPAHFVESALMRAAAEVERMAV